MNSRIMASVLDQSHTRCNRIEICKGHISGCEHSPVAIDKCKNNTYHVPVRNTGGKGYNRSYGYIQTRY